MGQAKLEWKLDTQEGKVTTLGQDRRPRSNEQAVSVRRNKGASIMRYKIVIGTGENQETTTWIEADSVAEAREQVTIEVSRDPEIAEQSA